MSTATEPEGTATSASAHEAKYLAAQEDPDFQDLRRRYRGYVLPVAAAALAWYFLYVLLSAYADSFMSRSVIGNLNVGLVMGLLQFVTTFGITALYIRFADKKLDPVSTRIREKFEKEGVL